MENKRTIGGEKEALAEAYLVKCGYKILTRNFYAGQGELDLIALDKGVLVFFEVKYRKNTVQGYPEEAVTVKKQKRMAGCAKYYMYKYGFPPDHPCRFDVIAVLGGDLRHIENAFWL